MALAYDNSTNLAELHPVEPLTLAETKNKRHRQRALISLALILIDALVLFVAFEMVYFLRFKTFGFLYVPPGSVLRFYHELVLFLIPPWLLIFGAYRLYDLRVLHGGTTEYRRVTQACSFAIIVLLGLSFFLDDRLVISRAWLLMIWFFTIVTVSFNRMLIRRVLYYLRRRGLGLTRVLLVGANRETCQVAYELNQGRNPPGLEIIGFVGDRRTSPRQPVSNAPHHGFSEGVEQRRATAPQWPGRWLGLIPQVREVVDQHGVDEVLIASTALQPEELFEVIRLLSTSKVEIRMSPSMYEILTTGLEVQEINGLPLVTIQKVRITGLNAIMKRTVDIAVAAGILLILSPILLFVAGLVRLDSSGPALFRRRVIGQGGKLFDAYKFRTMRADGNAILACHPELQEELERTGKLKKDPRITRIGRFLRKTSLDELPQLINVLFGQMSLVGPRMITYQEMVRFGRWQANLMTVKPGLTGLWQVSGRSNLTYDDRVRLDMHYIRNYSLWADLQILVQTVPAVLRGTGAY
jgi:exopolysaccharide biosynthesis polyprenyl glycosylphosphotransferase